MATFNIYIYRKKRREDGCWKVYIRFSHKRKVRDIPTTMFVTKKDVTPSFKIKNNKILDRCEELIHLFKLRMYELNLEVNDIDIDSVVEYMTSQKEKNDLSFTEWANKWISEKNTSSSKNYKTALSTFLRYIGKKNIMMSDVNTASLNGFVKYLKDKPRAVSLYPNAIKKMFNDARDHYNDEENNIIRIKQTLRKFKVPKQNVAEKRALTTEQIRAIFSLSYDDKKSHGFISRHDLALDCFRLSFALMGMNSADLFSCKLIENRVIKYNRAKTRGRRDDKAYIEVKIPTEVLPIYEKWKDEEGDFVFSFYKRFTNAGDMNKAINKGLKKIGDELGIANLQFYSARHSMATIAVNEVGIDMWTVNLMLCHTAPSMKVTELYVTKDFKQENEAMQRIMNYVLEK